MLVSILKDIYRKYFKSEVKIIKNQEGCREKYESPFSHATIRLILDRGSMTENS